MTFQNIVNMNTNLKFIVYLLQLILCSFYREFIWPTHALLVCTVSFQSVPTFVSLFENVVLLQ